MRRTATASLVLLIAASLSLGAAAGTLLAPTGSSAVGRKTFRWTDQSRREALSARADDKREVVAWVWYPAAPGSSSKTVPYVDQLNLLARAMPSSEVSLARSMQTHAVEGAPPAPAPVQFPVLLFSPGSDTTPALYTSICEELASRGYVVAAIDHPYDDQVVLLSDGRIVKQAKEPNGGEELLRYERERVTVRAQDLRFALDQLARAQIGAIDSPLRGRLDLDHVGVFGHSVGGMTAAETCMRDSRVKACANMDGVVSAVPAYLDEAGRGPGQPFLYIEKPLPPMKGEKQEDMQRRLAFLRGRGNAALSNVRSGKSYRVTIAGATHATFSDEEILTGSNPVRQRQLLGFVRDYLRDFFDQSLKNQPAALLHSAPPDSDIRIQAFEAK